MVDERIEILESILSDIRGKALIMKNNVEEKETDERIQDLYLLLKESFNNELFDDLKDNVVEHYENLF